MEMVLIKKESEEWNKMWEQLEQHPINEGIEMPSLAINNGEAWQYVGSFRQGIGIIHEFRHRNHPRFERIEKISFKGTENLSAEDIEKTIAVR